MPKQRGRILPITISVLLIIGAVFASVFYYNHWNQTVLANSKGAVEVVESKQDSSKDLQTIIHEAQKHVVQIEAVGPFGASHGSGFVYNNKGDIVTNAHVVKNADDIFVKTSDASTYPGALIGISKEQDVAVIRVPQLANRGSLDIKPTFEPNIGDNIIVVGSPLGIQGTFTDGIISGKDVSFEVDGYQYNNVYSVSANVTQGNSGGPLIHLETGLIIGINSAATKQGNMGFSIPISQVYDLIQMWSDKADNEELNYNGDPNNYQSIEPETLKNDATYLINYYFDTLNVRDYFEAYSLLGSDAQTKRSYQEFRELSVQAVKIDLLQDQMTYEFAEQDKIKVSVTSNHHIRKDESTMEIHHFETTFNVGYENDQLKILSFKRELLSKTEQTIENPNNDNNKQSE